MAGRSLSVRRLAGGSAVAALVGLAFAVMANPAASAAPRAVPGPAVSGLGRESSRQAGQKPAVKAPAKKDPYVKFNEPWPDAAELASRRVEAEKRPLFASDEPLAFTLTADFGAINNERGANSTRRFAAVMQLQGDGGRTISIPVQLGARDHARRNVAVCSVVPLRLEFSKKDVAGTVFDGQRELKLVTHCQNDRNYEQYVLTEYLAYRLYALLTPRSFRTRLVRATYVEAGRNRTPPPRYGMFVENDDDLARRIEGRVAELPNRPFKAFDQDALTWMFLVQFMVGNTDYSIMALHNIKIVSDRSGLFYPIGYDFDYSGLVNSRYAVADKRLGIYTVRERLYRGPCRTAREFEPFLATLRAKGPDLLALVDAIPDFAPGPRQEARKYLNEFLSLAGDPPRIQRMFDKSCVSASGM
jgi:hypothetical protein